MIGKEIKSSKIVPLYRVKGILKERTENAEATYEQTAVLEYAKKFCKIGKTKGSKLLEELKNIEDVDEKLAIKITDILPDNLERLRLLLPKGCKLGEDKLKEILRLVEKYSK